MRMRKFFRRVHVLAFVSFLWMWALYGQQVLNLTDPSVPLETRWNRAEEEAGNSEDPKGMWVGYSIDRMMEENSWIGSFHTLPDAGDRSLFELITGIRTEVFPGNGMDGGQAGGGRRMVRKEVAFLFDISGPLLRPAEARRVVVTNVSLPVDLHGKPLMWLGKASLRESLAFLRKAFPGAGGNAAVQMIRCMGLHGNVDGVFGFLSDVVLTHEDARVRESAAFWIGQLDTSAGLAVLVKVAREEQSVSVADKAIFALSRMSGDAATEALIALARNAPAKETRKKAVFWLGERATHKATTALREFVENGKDEEIQKQALFALSRLPDREGVSEMIRIAKTHPNPRLRKQAIFWLGESEDPSAFEALVEIASGKP